ncbi:unnamed protein product [Vicia faba]|uniref:Reverse transcriptase zinc-binding domain-containing protein n=1 Tax=Vicia faba TaxID=3906 RepID=A0AAV1AD56_VICFA|nr:unnamed protein product [Vicia faba]
MNSTKPSWLQIWRLHVDPNTLVANVIKAKNHPQEDVLNAKVGNKPSYLLRSLQGSIEHVKKGSCWNIRNDSILEITLYNLEEDEWLGWKANKDWHYNIKSNYHSIYTWSNNNLIDVSDINKEARVWKKLWKAKATPRKIILVWRFLNDIISVREYLNAKNITKDILCPRCNSKMETIDQCFSGGQRVQHLWYGSQLNHKFTSNTYNYFNSWSRHNIPIMPEETLNRCINIIDSIWKT